MEAKVDTKEFMSLPKYTWDGTQLVEVPEFTMKLPPLGENPVEIMEEPWQNLPPLAIDILKYIPEPPPKPLTPIEQLHQNMLDDLMKKHKTKVNLTLSPKQQAMIDLMKKDPKAFKELVDKSGATTAHLGAGEDALAICEKMLLEKGFIDWEAIPADPYTLQIDLDMPKEQAEDRIKPFLNILNKRLDSEFGLSWVSYPSKSGSNTHVVIIMPLPMEQTERLAWQVVFGDDPMRSALNLMGCARGVLNQVQLFMPRDRSDFVYQVVEPEGYPRRIKKEDEDSSIPY